MKVVSTKNFDRDVRKIRDKKLAAALKRIIEEMIEAETIAGLTNIKKLKAEGNYYRARYSDYRLGFKISDKTITLLCFMHRKDIYKYFPDNY